jgi:hypothetical protein
LFGLEADGVSSSAGSAWRCTWFALRFCSGLGGFTHGCIVGPFCARGAETAFPLSGLG